MVVPESSINNIMGGLESTGGVRLHNHKRKLKQRFDLVKKLGQGTYGKVQLGINKETGQEVAIKTIKKCKIETEADLIRIRREIQIMSSVQHPNIIHIYEVFENREKMVLVMEYAAGGELYDFLSERKVLAEEEARRIFRQIATAVYYCHKHKICHRDLKLENILLDENGNAKIADFGLSNVFEDSRLLSTFCGSPLYASPEIVKGTPYHGPEVDCWSLGVLLYTLVYGAMPFDGSNFKRLVRQISQGDYFEPKKPSPASPLIRDMLNVNPARRADIVAICSHWWIDENQSEACMDVAEELANQTPVRLDLLLCLAPSGDNDKLLLADQPPIPEGGDRPLRSQSLSSLATAQPDFLPEASTQSRRDTESRSKRKEEGGSVKRKERSRSRRERSSSRSRRDDSTPEPDSVSEKPKRKSVKSRKSREESQVVEEPKEEMLQPKIPEVEEELAKSTETIRAPRTPVDEVPKAKSPVPSDEVVVEEVKEEPTTPSTPVAPEQPSPASAENNLPAAPAGVKPSATVILDKPQEKEKEKVPEEEKPAKPMERRKSKIFETAEKFNKIGTAEAQPKPQPKKIVLPGVKVGDAKKAYERRSSLASSTTNFVRGSASRKSLSGESSMSPPPVDDTKFSLASTVALNKLVENVEKLSKMEDEKEKSVEKNEERKSAEKVKPSPEKVIEVKKEETKTDNKEVKEDETRKKKAVQLDVEWTDNLRRKTEAEKKEKLKKFTVIGNAITEGISGDGKAATLPRRRTSRAEIKLTMPPPKPVEFRSEVEHMVGAPAAPAPPPAVQRSEVKFPVAAPSPPPVSRATPVRQGSTPREYIVPIQMEDSTTTAGTTASTTATAAVKPPAPPAPQRPVSRTSSKSLSRQSTGDSDFGSTASMGEPIRKSPREVIIPIAVEGGGYVTPSAEAISRMSSLNESEDDVPRGFGLHSTRRPTRQLETADSVSSDEDDDNFEILTAENLFSTLLSRVRSLTQRLNTEDRQTAFPRLFNHHHSIFDIPPSRRLTEARSFGRADSVPWRRSMSRESSTLPRDGSISRIGALHRTASLKSSGKEKPPPYRSTARNTSEGSRSLYYNPHSNNSAQSITEDSSQSLNSTETTGNEKQENKTVDEGENANRNNSRIQTPRGIPTAEIIGSSVKKPTKSDAKSESTKKSSKLPRLLIKNAQENRPDDDLQASGSSKTGDRGAMESTGSQPVPRRNSLERPSYYNSLYKTGFRPYNDIMTRSLNLPSDHVLNGETPPDPSTSLNSDNLNKLDKILTSSVIDGDRSGSDLDYHSIRPYGTLGRAFSLKNPSVRSYGILKTPVKSSLGSDIESKYMSPGTTISRGSSLKEGGQRPSRFLRPKSFYGATDLSSYSVPSSPSCVTSTGEPIPDPLSERKSAFASRRSPSYQRSISLFEGKKPEIYQRSLSVTPDRSVLGKFFNDKKVENDPTKALKDSSREKPRVRKVSRFLRPDFYDTPKEDSAYEKKEKVKNVTNGQIWKEKTEKTKQSESTKKKTSKKSQEESKASENRVSIVDKAIRSLKENSVGRNDYDSLSRESNLIKRAVSLEDCSLVPESRVRRSTSLTPQSHCEKKSNNDKFESMFQKKKFEDYKKIVDQKLNSRNKESGAKQESVIDRISRKLSPKNAFKKVDEQKYCNGVVNVSDSQMEEANQESRSRLSRIAGLKRLEFSRPIPSADSTPSVEDSKFSGDCDDSSSFLSPTEDGSDTWSISSEYADARDILIPSANEDSVSERIRRKSFYSRFNQTKRRKSSQSGQLNGSRSRLPMYSKSLTSDLSSPASSKHRKTSDPEPPVEK